jgi:hypothetical protein
LVEETRSHGLATDLLLFSEQAASTVFVVDDDDLVRASIQGMLKSVSLRSEAFGTA